jgi:phage terminase large subunit-like protein
VPRKAQPFDEFEEFRRLAEGLQKQAVAPDVNRYEPHAKQLEFHSNQCQERLFVAGNRSGKSLASVIEGIYYLTGTHPWRKTPAVPVRGRVVAVDFLNGVDKILLPLYKQWLPTEYLIDGVWEKSYSQERHTLTLNNGSFVEFMSQDQDLDKFAGTSRHFIHFDEECPKVIFDECLMRLIDTDGDWWISETPVSGMEWIYDDLYEPAINGLKPSLGLIEASTTDNPHISKNAIERLLSMFSEEDRLMREKGQYTTVTGQLFKLFRDKEPPDGHVIPRERFDLTDEYRLYLTGDHGFNAPTAWLWIAVHRNGSMVIFEEHYLKETTVEEHARAIKAMNKKIGRDPYLITGDPAMSQRSGISGGSILDEYSRHGIEIQTTGIDRNRMVGINKLNQYLKLNRKTKMPFLLITENCVNTRREMKGAKQARIVNKLVASRKNAPEGQRDKDDHTTDAIRYLITLMADLTPEDFDGTGQDKFYDTGVMLGGYSETHSGYDNRRRRGENHGWRDADSDTIGLE